MSYVCHDIFMIRTPALPVKIAKSIYGKDYRNVWKNIESLGLTDYLKEALLISSPSLYEAIQRMGKDEKKDEATYLSIYKYLIRASTRTTPYGLMANVALGSFEEHNHEILNKNIMKKSICADNLWIYKLIRKLESTQEVVEYLSLTWNNSCQVCGKRVCNPHFSNHGILENASNENSSIRYSHLVELIKNSTDTCMNYLELVNTIGVQYPTVTRGKIINTVNTLIEQEYLFTDLRIPAYCKDTINHILDILDKYQLVEEMRNKLQILIKYFTRYENSKKGESLLKTITKEMKSIVEAKSYIEINSGATLENAFVGEIVRSKLENFAECIGNISMESQVCSPLKKFKQQFQEEYGTNIEVPVVQVVDSSG